MLEKFIFCWIRGAHILFVFWIINIAFGLPMLILRWCESKMEFIAESAVLLGLFLLIILAVVPPIFYLLSYFCGIRLASWANEDVENLG